MTAAKVGILLSNLGTPEGPEAGPVRKYLGQFLMDPAVIDIPWIARWLLVHGVILRTRPRKSAQAYRKIWTARGSPLLFHTLDLADQVRERLDGNHIVAVGMRYGNPSIESAVAELVRAGVSRIVFLPLYPQYSLAATGSSAQEFKRVLKDQGVSLPVSIIEDFWSDEGFLDAFVEMGRPLLANQAPDHVLFSFHGIPERHVQKVDASGGAHCLKSSSCCEQIVSANARCYRAQSFQTAYRLANKLGLSKDKFSVSFQSRLGRTPWIQPYTDVVLDELVAKGVRRLAVYSPSFVADCLETIEEIEMRGREQFRARGGEELWLIPSLNSTPKWAEAVAQLVSIPGIQSSTSV